MKNFEELRNGANSPEKLIDSMNIFKGRILRLRVDEVELPDGKRSSREVVEHSGAVVVIPVLDNGNIILVKQYRHAVGEFLLELPAGKVEEGDGELGECARRELLEETNYSAERFEKIIEFYSSPGMTTEKMHLFIARGLKPERHDRCDFDEFISRAEYSLAEILDMILKNEITDAKTILGILFYNSYSVKDN